MWYRVTDSAWASKGHDEESWTDHLRPRAGRRGARQLHEGPRGRRSRSANPLRRRDEPRPWDRVPWPTNETSRQSLAHHGGMRHSELGPTGPVAIWVDVPRPGPVRALGPMAGAVDPFGEVLSVRRIPTSREAVAPQGVRYLLRGAHRGPSRAGLVAPSHRCGPQAAAARTLAVVAGASADSGRRRSADRWRGRSWRTAYHPCCGGGGRVRRDREGGGVRFWR